jgi:hypothetical protein
MNAQIDTLHVIVRLRGTCTRAAARKRRGEQTRRTIHRVLGCNTTADGKADTHGA